MPTTITTPSNTLAKVRFQEQYVSEGLNKKFNGAVPRGVLRGGLLVTAGAGLNVRIDADPDTGDSIYSYIDTNGHQLTFRQVGNVTLDLTSVLSTTIFVCLFVQYTTSTATVVEWRTYSQAELITAPVAEAGELIVLGRVVVPGAGPIAASAITPLERREAWDAISKATIPWQQIVENGRFDLAKPGAITSFGGDVLGWSTIGLIAASRTWTIATVAPNNGPHELQVNGGAGFTSIDTTFGNRQVAVNAGDKVRAAFFIRGSTWTGIGASGVQGILLTWYDIDKQVLSTTDITDNTLSGTFAYTEIDQIVEAPAGAAYMEYAIQVDPDGNSPTGDLFFDDVRVWVESNKHLQDDKLKRLGYDTLRPLVMEFPPSSGFTDIGEFIDLVTRLAYFSGTPAGDAVLQWQRMGAGGTGLILRLIQGILQTDRYVTGSPTASHTGGIVRAEAQRLREEPMLQDDRDAGLGGVLAEMEGGLTTITFDGTRFEVLVNCTLDAAANTWIATATGTAYRVSIGASTLLDSVQVASDPGSGVVLYVRTGVTINDTWVEAGWNLDAQISSTHQTDRQGVLGATNRVISPATNAQGHLRATLDTSGGGTFVGIGGFGLDSTGGTGAALPGSNALQAQWDIDAPAAADQVTIWTVQDTGGGPAVIVPRGHTAVNRSEAALYDFTGTIIATNSATGIYTITATRYILDD